MHDASDFLFDLAPTPYSSADSPSCCTSGACISSYSIRSLSNGMGNRGALFLKGE